MNQKIAIIITTLFFTLLLPAQTITIEYTSQNISDPRTFEGLPEVIKKYSLAKRHFTLIVNNNESLYYKTPGQAPIIDIPITEKGQYITYSDEHYYYKNQTENLMLFELSEGERTVKGKDQLPIYEWDTRSEETKKIKGYKCKRATLWKDNILYIAYYTTELPAGNGPDRFGGLPGTILKLKFRKIEYTARSIKIKKENTVIERPVFTGETQTYAEHLAKSRARNESEQAKYPVKDYGAVKLIMKSEADVETEKETIKD
jgi:GLPGLI family protein